jgi:hypothetical protein
MAASGGKIFKVPENQASKERLTINIRALNALAQRIRLIRAAQDLSHDILICLQLYNGQDVIRK